MDPYHKKSSLLTTGGLIITVTVSSKLCLCKRQESRDPHETFYVREIDPGYKKALVQAFTAFKKLLTWVNQVFIVLQSKGDTGWERDDTTLRLEILENKLTECRFAHFPPGTANSYHPERRILVRTKSIPINNKKSNMSPAHISFQEHRESVKQLISSFGLAEGRTQSFGFACRSRCFWPLYAQRKTNDRSP